MDRDKKRSRRPRGDLAIFDPARVEERGGHKE